MSEVKSFRPWHFVAAGTTGFLAGVVLTHFFGLYLQFPHFLDLKHGLKAESISTFLQPDSDRIEHEDKQHSVSLEDRKTSDLDAISDLRRRNLLFPLKGFTLQGVRDTFNESRGSHIHEAIDIVAPRNTPVVAVEDGTVARLWYSRYGGITIYHFDPTQTYAYYYAHLERYAPNLQEGDHLSRGQVIGYVGTSGNAPPETPHLHFTIFHLTKDKHWWEGTPINPYLVYQNSVEFRSPQ